MKKIPCNNCNATEFTHLYDKMSSKEETFSIVKCNHCGLVQVNPQPSVQEVAKYYSNEYFMRRTDRGYNNYYSEASKKEIRRVFTLNLEDLRFFEWEHTRHFQEKRSLDIGCAAGYFVDFMQDRGWSAKGIDIAKEPVEFASGTLGLDVIRDDFLQWDLQITEKFDLITLWASIEHLHQPRETLEKIFRHLKPNGRLIVSTCRYGILAAMQGKEWRFMNVPEHLYYYTSHGLIEQMLSIGFQKQHHITYGSGMTGKAGSGWAYQFFKKIADNLVKATDQGDMIAIVCSKP
ncbi:MAG: class I SAM-dependent methyltransferase [Spirochaetota bacterium]